VGDRRPFARRVHGGATRREPARCVRRPRVLGGVCRDRPVGPRPRGDLDLRHARCWRAPDVGRGGPSGPARGRGVRADRGRQPRADGLVHGPAQRPARGDQPRGPAGPGRRGDGHDARRAVGRP
jgi:hypothetical protein